MTFLLPLTRSNFYNMRCEKVTSYERTIHREEVKRIWRYAFRREGDSQKFVYSGVHLPGVLEGDVTAFRATIKAPLDQWGFIRLSCVKLISNVEQML